MISNTHADAVLLNEIKLFLQAWHTMCAVCPHKHIIVYIAAERQIGKTPLKLAVSEGWTPKTVLEFWPVS